MKPLLTQITQNSLIPAGLAITVGIWVSKVESRIDVQAAMIQRQENARAEEKSFLNRVESLLTSIDERLSNIEGQLKGKK